MADVGTTANKTGVSTSDCEARMLRAVDGLHLTHVQPGRSHLTLSFHPAGGSVADGVHFTNLTDLTKIYAAAGYSSLLVLNDSHLLCLWEMGGTISMMHIPLHPTTANGAGDSHTRLLLKSDDVKATKPSSYNILWSSGGTITDSALAKAGMISHSVWNWSPHYGKIPKTITCSLASGQPHGACVQSLWPQINTPPQPNVNGGVPQAANLTAHLELLR